MPRPENAELYKRYQALAEQTEGVYFVGRLATYRYYNMDQVVAQALTVYARMMGVNRNEAITLEQEPTLAAVHFPFNGNGSVRKTATVKKRRQALTIR